MGTGGGHCREPRLFLVALEAGPPWGPWMDPAGSRCCGRFFVHPWEMVCWAGRAAAPVTCPAWGDVPQSSPQRASLLWHGLSASAGRGQGRDCGPPLAPVGWWVILPRHSVWPSSRGVSMGFALPGALSWTRLDPSIPACGSCTLTGFLRQKCLFSGFFLPAVTTAKYFYFRGSCLLPLHRLAPGAVWAVPALPDWVCEAKPLAATSRLGQSPAPGVLSPLCVRERWERCV